ncbi:hypothetical protein [Adhaeribacter aquaticus]|uniref:hypothetical protein n=1 Tax=Adhaeribacter aquaticus TaxID=299567 RepID=UPI000401C7BE|nr:hypothetical protein [Adhaeribacter aquaticus]
MTFNINEAQAKKLKEWQNALKLIYGEVGILVYKFTPNGIHVNVEVYSENARASIDITDSDNF